MQILIIEDDKEHWDYIKRMLQGIDGYTYFPVKDKDFEKIRDNINFLYSPRDRVKNDAKTYLIDITNNIDFLLIDYELNEDVWKINCIDLYLELALKTKALIYTKYKAENFTKISEDIRSLSLNKRMNVIQKPEFFSEVYLLPKTIKYLKDNIDKVLNIKDEATDYDSKK